VGDFCEHINLYAPSLCLTKNHAMKT